MALFFLPKVITFFWFLYSFITQMSVLLFLTNLMHLLRLFLIIYLSKNVGLFGIAHSWGSLARSTDLCISCKWAAVWWRLHQTEVPSLWQDYIGGSRSFHQKVLMCGFCPLLLSAVDARCLDL